MRSAPGQTAVRPDPPGLVETFPALVVQQGLIFHGLLEPEAGADLVQILIEVPGELRRDEFERAWQRAADRHPALRTAFDWHRADQPVADQPTPAAHEPVQIVHERVPFVVDWRDDPTGAALEPLLRADRAAGFDPEHAPLVRVTVLSSVDRHTVVVTMHHAVLDGRSIKTVLHEVFADYDAACTGQPMTFPLRPPYGDFATWWSTVDHAVMREFWTAALSGFTAPTPLGFAEPAGEAGVEQAGVEEPDGAGTGNGSPGPKGTEDGVTGDGATGEVRSASVVAELPAATTLALRSLATRTDVTINTLVHAVWALLLGAFSGHSDVVFGIIRSCRRGSVRGADDMVGMMINTLPLRVPIDPDRTLADWLAELRRHLLEVRDHQLAPLAWVRQWAAVPSAVPLFESVVAYENTTMQTALRALDPRWLARSVELRRNPSYPLTLYAFGERCLRLELIYHRQRFTPPAAELLLRRVTGMLTTLSTLRPDQRVDDLPVLDEAERRLLLDRWSGAGPRVGSSQWSGAGPGAGVDTTVPAGFAAQAAATPYAPAVICGETTLSYAELDAQANQLAHLLGTLGVRVDTPVAVALPRSALLVVALLAVLKAGGAYVALDAANPPARNRQILADCRARLVLTSSQQATHEQATHELADPLAPSAVRLLPLDTITAELAAQPSTAPDCPARPDSLAYVSYTSGSTGAPKGVAVPHRGVIRLVTRPTFASFGAAETLLQLAPVAFDASTLELWASLLTGARLVVAPPGPLDLAGLAAVLREHRVTTLWLTAGLFHQVVECDPGALAGVRQLLAGGDVLAPEAVRTALVARGGQPVINGYGPTENTTFTCCHRMTDPDAVADPVPIGRPIQRSTVYVLDSWLRPVPVGAPGELYTGGDGLARGYLGRPDLTAERFVANPFGTIAGERLYRTGDRARWRRDGTLEFLGRCDFQVKIRGFRTEPGEVEAVLRTHPDVGDAVVVVAGEGAACQLVGYVARRAGAATLTVAELRAHAASRLPAHLCPASYMLVDRLPLTVSGKVDRSALPAPVLGAGGASTPLATPTQQRLAELWGGLLHAGPFGADDNFFTVGGDSLAAIRLIFQVRRALAVDLPIRDLFANPTLAGTAAVIDRLQQDSLPSMAHLVTIPRRGAGGRPTMTAPLATPAVLAPAALPDHLAGLTERWAAWRWVGVRSTGLPIRAVLDLADSACAAAADELLAARADASAATHELTYQLRRLPATVAADPTIRRALAQLRKGRLAEALPADWAGGPARKLADPVAAAVAAVAGADAMARALAALRRLAGAETAYQRSFMEASQRRSDRLRRAANDPRLREAVAWQNRHALRTGVDAVARGDTADHGDAVADGDTVAKASSSRQRQHEALVANYLQRYATKNDTIGFFGPVGWARLSADQGEALAVAPGPSLLAARTVYLEDWCVGALAARLAEDPHLRPWLSPRRLPFVSVVDGWLHLPLAPPIPVAPLTEAVLLACDGQRSAAEVAAAVRASPTGQNSTVEDVYAVLAELRSAGRIVWTLEPPSDAMFPERALRQRLARVADEPLRESALQALAKLEHARDQVAQAAGDGERVAAAIEALERTFTGLTGLPPTRRDGRVGAGRTLVYEDCRRDVTVTVGAPLIESLRAPLALLLESARWFTFAGAALFQRLCVDIYQRRSRELGRPDVSLAEVWLWVNDLFLDRSHRLVAPVVRGLQSRWAGVLGHSLGASPGQHRVRCDTAAIEEAVESTFAVPRPGWVGAVQHSPDLMIAAGSVDDVRAGRFEWVVGELHPGLNTLSSALFVTQHPDPSEIYQAMAADLPFPRVLVAASHEELGAPIRITNVVAGPDDLRLVFARDTCGLDPRRTLLTGQCLVEQVQGHLMVRTRDGRHSFALIDVLGEMLALHLLQHFRILPDADHSPRVTVDRMVLSRESWSFAPAELSFAGDGDEGSRFLAARRWRQAHAMPQYVFVRTTAESKPFFVDFDSLSSVDLLARAVRRAGRTQSAAPSTAGRVTVTEMLPEPDRLWLTDAQGERYTAELRLVAVDLRHAGRPPTASPETVAPASSL